MSALISISEIKQIFDEQDIKEYYIDIDMNGAVQIALSPNFTQSEKILWEEIYKIDQNRSSVDIENTNDILYPLKRIFIDDDDDVETKERLKEQNIQLSPYSQQLNTWLHYGGRSEKKEKRPPRVAFYSYKGGVGRSTSLAIVARLLALDGLHVAVIDLDLEAPGLNSLLLTKPKTSPFGVVDYLYHAPWIHGRMDKKRFLSQYVIREEVKRRNQNPGQISVMTAGGTKVWGGMEDKQLNLLFDEDKVEITLEPNYLKKLGYIDFDLYARQSNHVFEMLLQDLATHTGADIILIDGRTGISNVSGALINQFSDVLSIHVQDNLQNREGIGFINQYIENKKSKNIIWSYTKAPKRYGMDENNLKKYIGLLMNKEDEVEDDMLPHIHYLPFHSDLEDITPHELERLTQIDKIPPGYKELAVDILSLTGLDQRLSSYISQEDRREIITNFHTLVENDWNPIYISQRFLNEDLQLYVGYPGSGKKTFADYMQEKYQRKVEVVQFQQFNEMGKSPHQILSHVIFLDWTYDEATQAICKWMLQNEVFYRWLKRNNHRNGIDEKELREMRENPEYELSLDDAEAILNMVFGKIRHMSGWRIIFSRLQYREKYVLPQDVIQGVQLYIKYFINNRGERLYKRTSQDSIFPLSINFERYQAIWMEIGERKKQWLSEYDMNLYYLVQSFIQLDTNSMPRSLYVREDSDVLIASEQKEKLRELFVQYAHKEHFEEVLEKAQHMDIFIKRGRGYWGREGLDLSPVYRLITLDQGLMKHQ